MKTEAAEPIKPAMRCLIAGAGAILALLAFILNVGGLDLLSRMATSLLSTSEGWIIVLIPIIASLVGYFLARLNRWLILIVGALIALAGAGGITIHSISKV